MKLSMLAFIGDKGKYFTFTHMIYTSELRISKISHKSMCVYECEYKAEEKEG